MAIEFKREVEYSRILNPASNFEEKSTPVEFRYDPLTGDMGSVWEYRPVKLAKPDLADLVAKSLEIGCPFCPENVEKVTPKFTPDFLPEGRIKVGKAIAFPNVQPYVVHSGLAIFSSQHFFALSDFTEDTIADGLLVSQAYLKTVIEHEPEARYCVINWNYMPPSGGSQIHPHLQLLVERFPLAYHKKLMEGSKSYYMQNGTNYWSDLIAEEKRLNERYIATIGDTVWLTSFVPKSGFLDVTAIFQENESLLTLSAKDIKDFCSGLTKVFNYMDDQDYYSFNLCLYSGIIGENHFWTQARLVQRYYVPPLNVSDINPFQILLEVMPIYKRPESVCQEIKNNFY